MGTTTQPIPISIQTVAAPAPQPATGPRLRWPVAHVLTILGFWLAIFAASLATPALLDDADATHAEAAQAMLSTGDLITLHVDGIRYLEKAPLPYWLAALSLRLFTTPPTLARRAAFAIHLPIALTVLGLALLGYTWSRRAFGQQAALYTAVFTLSSAGVFLFTRIFIPDALLSLLLALAFYAFLRALEPYPTPNVISTGAPHPSNVISTEGAHLRRSGEISAFFTFRHTATLHAHLLWLFLALAVLTKGLVALVLFFGAALLFGFITRTLSHWRRLAPITGPLLFLTIAAPWHILAGLRNTGAADGHGFFWFYFVNEHVLRFLGERIPRDYNKLPTALYWSLHLVWLFPWSLFAPAALWSTWSRQRHRLRPSNANGFAGHTVLLLSLFSALLLVFFSLSTNQEYYTFPAYLPLLMLLATALVPATNRVPQVPLLGPGRTTATAQHRALTFTYATLTLIGLALALTLAYGLWQSRYLAFIPDIGSVLAHRGVGGYTLSMSHFFDLTSRSFAALRLPTMLAAAAFALGPGIALALHARRRPQAAILTVAFTSAIFLIAAHIALQRFAPMLSSQDFAARIQQLESDGRISNDTEILIYGDHALGSSIPFYLQHQVLLVDGRSTSMLFGSSFPDAPPIFLTPAQLLVQWGTGPRKILFVPLEQRTTVDHLLGPNQVLLKETSGKALITDRPLASGIWHLETDPLNPARPRRSRP